MAASVVAASVDGEVVLEPSLAPAAACVFPCAVFGVTGAVAATAEVRAEASVGACAPAVAVTPAAEMPAFAAVGGLPDGAADAVAGSVLPWTDGPDGGESGCELAAIAAAAIASGAVGPPEAGVVVGTLAAGAVVEIAAATGVGVVGALPTCWARIVASTAVASPPASLLLDLSPSDFDVPEIAVVVVPVVDWLVPLAVAPLLVAPPEADGSELELELDGDASLAAPSDWLFAGAGGVLLLALVLLLGPLALLLASFAGGALSAAGGGEASALFCAGGLGGGGGAAFEWAGVLWLTKCPKRSLPGAALARASHAGAVWNAALAAAAWSGGALSTVWPPEELTRGQQGPGHLTLIFNV